MVTTNYQIKVIDFGFGVPLYGRDGSGFLRTRVGTLPYLSPEITNELQ